MGLGSCLNMMVLCTESIYVMACQSSWFKLWWYSYWKENHPFSAQSVHLFLGILIGGEGINQHYDDSTKSRFLKEIKETSLPVMKTFGDKLLHGNLSHDDVFRYFMVVALSSFLCPNSSTLLSPKYLGALIDVKSVNDWDWSKFVFEWLWSSISTYRKKKRQTIGGCRYFFAVSLVPFLFSFLLIPLSCTCILFTDVFCNLFVGLLSRFC